MRVPVPMVCAAALGMAITRAARADDNQMLGTTPRSMAMAGAYTAIADDPAALYYNPAGLAQIDGSYINVAILLSFPSLNASGPSPLTSEPIDKGYSLNLAWSPRSILDGNLGLGFSLQLPHQKALHFQVHRFDEPYFVLYENSTELLEIRLGAAYKFFDLFSIGASALLLAGLDGHVTLKSPFQSATDPIDPTMRTEVTVNANLPSRQFFTAGAQAYPIKGLTLGLSYREASYLRIQLPIDFTIMLLGLSPITTLANLDVKVKYAPAQLNFGAAYQVTSDLLLSADLGYAWYDERPCGSGQACAPDAIPYGNVSVQAMGLGVTLLPPRQPVMTLRNILIPRVGAEYRVMDALVVRGGYYYFRSFIVGTDAPVIDSDKHAVSLGATYALGRYFLPEGTSFNLIAAGQGLFFMPRTVAGYATSGSVFSTSFGAEFVY
jgi:long-chain fatty acid transport protein